MLIISFLFIFLFALHTVDGCSPEPDGIFRFGPECGFMCHCRDNEQCDFTTGKCTSGCASMWYGPGCQYRDIAEGEFSRHSDNLASPRYSNLANDGDPTTCSYTAEVDSKEKKTTPFWRVWLPTRDTIRELMIVTLVKKLDNFKNFAVYVEDVPLNKREDKSYIPPNRQECYKHWDNVPKNATIMVVCNKPALGNQVRIELAELQTQLVLCDVRINGGCRPGAYGKNCSKDCSANCKGGHAQCSNENGNCLSGCNKGWKSPKCNKECNDGKYGQDCLNSCSKNCKYNAVCEKVNGRCPRGCNPGYRGENCDRECNDGKYGKDCLSSCSKNCKYNTVCEKVNGRCPRGCNPGYRGENCDRECNDGKYGQDCLNSCSKNCKYNAVCEKVNGRCPRGCNPGYRGENCDRECNDGKYGKDCLSSCSKNCKYNTVCEKVNGRCPRGCNPGYRGENCDRGCQNGTYGQYCSHTCNVNCKYESCDKVNGSCLSGCRPGYQGEQCNIRCLRGRYGKNCRNTCSLNCNYELCSNVNGKCSHGCKPGYQGEMCDQVCSIGFYGDRCSERCSQHCFGGYANCNNINGACSDRCMAGWKGRLCEEECDDGKYGHSCSNTCSKNCYFNKVCEKVNGKCPNGCKRGYRGDKCDQECVDGSYGINCSSSCSPHCRHTAICEKTNGRCPHGCKNGYTGSKCDRACNKGSYGDRCSKHCSLHCSGGYTKCNNVNGTCSDGCMAGWKGLWCDKECDDGTYGHACSKFCSKNCKNDAMCEKVYGVCPPGCKPGYRGDKCDQVCSKGFYGDHCSKRCSQHCSGGHENCSHINGTCSDGCMAGWKGMRCDEECDDGKYGKACLNTCSKNCKNNAVCEKINGQCPQGCKPGYRGGRCDRVCDEGKYGDGCSQRCSQHCFGGYEKCSDVDGTCSDGCMAGWNGAQCDKTCDEGKYGRNCQHHCSLNCKNGEVCEKVNGQCPYGCKSGYQGVKCEEKCAIGFYGEACGHNCTEYCDGGIEMCSNIDGRCQSGCTEGWMGRNCDTECEDGFHGANCSMKCGYCKKGTLCDKVLGICMEGCATGFDGDKCLLALEESNNSVESILGGVAVLVVFLISFTVIVLLYLRWKRRQRKEENREAVELTEHQSAYVNAGATTSTQATSSSINQTTREQNIYTNTKSADASKRSESAIPVSGLMAHVKANADQILKEFKAIPYGMNHPSTIGMKPYNRGKNKYKDMTAYDHSRVVLKTLRGEEGSDYINASCIKGYFKEQAYIAAQGPIETTIDDFWRMIWEKNVYTVAMLTNLVEETKMKCLQYWPTVDSSTKYGSYIVFTESETIYAEFTIRNLKVSFQGKSRNIRQFHYTAWPDKGVPRSASSLLQFWRKVSQNDASKSQTWLVHCSAGVGRTGTFIATDILFDQIRAKGYVDVHQCVKDLRDQRVSMVQTKDQYKFLYGLVIENFILPSEPVSLDSFHQEVNDLKDVDQSKRKTKLLLQYETLKDNMLLLSASDNTEDSYSAAKLAENQNKNRYNDILPRNEFRPFLETNIPNCTNYINAVYIPSYSDIRGFILTQKPMKNTAIDCCRLVYEQEVKVIVTFEDSVKKEVGTYLPENGSINLGPFAVVKTTEEDKQFYLKKTFKMSYGSEDREITQMTFKAWPKGRIIPNDPGTMLSFIQKVEYKKRAADNKPVIVQCLNGSERSGLFVVLMNILEHARLDNEVSIPQVIRQLRVRREQIIPNFEQFKFCYDVLLHHVDNSVMYANL